MAARYTGATGHDLPFRRRSAGGAELLKPVGADLGATRKPEPAQRRDHGPTRDQVDGVAIGDHLLLRLLGGPRLPRRRYSHAEGVQLERDRLGDRTLGEAPATPMDSRRRCGAGATSSRRR